MKENILENSKARLLVCGDTLTSGPVSGASVLNLESNLTGKNGGVFTTQTGSSLVIALAFIVILFAITAAAIRYSTATAKNTDSVSTKADEEWRAREISAYSTGWITEKLPKVFQRELAAAKATCGNQNLPAFNPESSSGAACENSLLGDFQAWLSSKIPAIETFGRDQIKPGEAATVGAALQDGGRVETGKTEKSYLVNYQVDVSAGEAGSQSKQGQIFLSAAWFACTAEATLRQDITIQAGQTAVLSGEYFNASKIELLENGTRIWQQIVVDRSTAQTYSVPVSPAATVNYTVLAYSNVESGCAGSSGSVTVSVSGVPTPTPTPAATPTPSIFPPPTPTPISATVDVGTPTAYSATWPNTCGVQFPPPNFWSKIPPTFDLASNTGTYEETFTTGRYETLDINIQTDKDRRRFFVSPNSSYTVKIQYQDLFQMETSRILNCSEGKGFENWQKYYVSWNRGSGFQRPFTSPFDTN
jgi:hypothetical protein